MAQGEDPFYEYYARESESPGTRLRFARTKALIEKAAREVGFASAPWTVADIGCGAGTQSLATPRTVVLALKAA